MAGLKAGRSNIDDVTDDDIMKLKRGRFCTIADPNVIAWPEPWWAAFTPLSEDGAPISAIFESGALRHRGASFRSRPRISTITTWSALF